MTDLTIRNNIARQYRGALAMLGHAVELCPDSLWPAPEYPNRFWHIAYHALFYTHLYLQPGEAAFRHWQHHRPKSQYLDPKIETPYSKAKVLEYHEFCCGEVESKVPSLDLEAESGFSWLPFNRLEVQFYNIRHLQHHTGQLADRLRTAAGIGLGWVRPE
jgi:hypothetical protein